MMKNLKEYQLSKKFPFFCGIFGLGMLFSNISILLVMIFVSLYLLEIITWSWWLIFLPLYYFIPLAFVGLLFDIIYNFLRKSKK